jgi:hypothetical protein
VLHGHEFFVFTVEDATPIATPHGSDNWELNDFSGGKVSVNQMTPVQFVHGINYSHLLPIILNDGRLCKSARTKDGLIGAWVAKAGDFATAEAYAGPERICGEWIQVLMVGTTWDLKSPHRHKKFRIIRSSDGHILRLIGVWMQAHTLNNGVLGSGPCT